MLLRVCSKTDNRCTYNIVMKSNYSDIIKDLDASVIVLLDKLKRYLSVGKSSVMVGCGFSLNAECDGTGCGVL